ncbi:hypothetical protein [Halorubrum sp. N11]|uniref:hypothetical protein n=1 Tax=Halorubrum sp. N11 TaxID=3402276 RepID=UPI003EBB0356
MTDIDQYKTYREVGTQLNNDILEAYSDRELIVETASELDIEFNGVNLAYEFESQMPAHFEFALYEYRETGRPLRSDTSKLSAGGTRSNERYSKVPSTPTLHYSRSSLSATQAPA